MKEMGETRKNFKLPPPTYSYKGDEVLKIEPVETSGAPIFASKEVGKTKAPRYEEDE